MTDPQQDASNNNQNNEQNNDQNASSQAGTGQANPELSAEDIQKLNAILGDIDTDEGIKGGVEDISNEEMEKVQEILFGEEDEDSKDMKKRK